MIKSLFWISIVAIFYTYIGYPVVVWVLGRLRNLKVSKSVITPSVTVVIACHNEANNIEARIKNLLSADYPARLLEIVIVSDGSTDLTPDIACRYDSNRVKVFAYNGRRGKATALNIGAKIASGEVIIFADARQWFEPDAIKELVSNFADARVGAVSGELLLDGDADATVGEGVGLYWKYEKWIRKSESRFNSVIGATGAVYAIRRRLWHPLPKETILDDVYTPMRIALAGSRIVFDEKARAHDIATDSASREFSRKVRTLTGNYQLCQLMPRVLLPTSALLFQFYSHKLTRLAAPIFFLILLVSNLAIVGANSTLFYEASLAAQIIFYASVLAGGYMLKRKRKVRVLNFAYVFSVMNAAALVSLIYFILGKRDVWVRGQ
jgi:poly-beta-1,6-N-acetyl-D-glucosamine synthase